MNLKTWLIILALLAIITAGVYFLFLGTKSQEKKIQQLNEEIAFLKQEVMPIRYTIISKNGKNITVGVKFYDLDGNQISKQRFTMEGNTVSFEFYVIKFDKGYIAFPVKIYTDLIAPEKGTSLFEYYEKNNFPQIYYSKKSSKAFNEGIVALFEKIKNNDFEDMDNVFGNMVQNHPKADTSKIDEDIAYKIIIHTKGGIEIIEDKQ
jgi:hypothetical protein